jgi:hypothetical protein
MRNCNSAEEKAASNYRRGGHRPGSRSRELPPSPTRCLFLSFARVVGFVKLRRGERRTCLFCRVRYLYLQVRCYLFGVMFAIGEEICSLGAKVTVKKDVCRFSAITGPAQDLIASDPIHFVP